MVESMLQYIQESPTGFHAVANLANRLTAAGYTRLAEGEWDLVPGGRYFVTRGGTALLAFRMPEGKAAGFVVSAAHCDSPCFRLRDHAELKGEFIRLSAERYGGMILDCWLDRPLAVAGRVLVRTETGIETRLVDLKKPMAVIPHVAPHLNREAASGMKYDPARDMPALYAAGANAGSFEKEVAEAAHCAPEDILARDLYLVNEQPGFTWGPANEFVSSPRLDDLACVYACAEGFLSAGTGKNVPVLAVFDNEEIGSETKTGAASTLLPETLKAISDALGRTEGEHRAAVAASFMLSCDNGHARHPNHPEMADANEAPVMNGGVVVKHSPRYATDGLSAAVFTEICRRAGVKTQHYSNRPDQAGGSTLGNIAATKFSVSTVDIGMAQLAMHSCFETMGAEDADSFAAAVKACYDSDVAFTASGAAL